jgi:hypothetical protein
MGMQLTSVEYEAVAPFFEAFEPLRRDETRFTDLQALMDLTVGGERCRVWSARIVSLESERKSLGYALVVGPRFPDGEEPAEWELQAEPREAAEESGASGDGRGYAVHGTLHGWAGVIRETERHDGIRFA